MQADLLAAAAPVVAAALLERYKRIHRGSHQGLGPAAAHELAVKLLEKYPDETLSALAARLAEGAEGAEALSSQRTTNFLDLRRRKTSSASSAPSALYVKEK